MREPGWYKISPSEEYFSSLTDGMEDDTTVLCDGQFFWYGDIGIPVNSLTIVIGPKIEEPKDE